MTRRRETDAPERDTLVDVKRTRLGVGEPARDAGSRAADAELIGKVLGGYLVQDELGAGAMGVVYRAVHLDTNRVVALKALRADFLEEPTAVQRLRREARVASRLGHPHVGGLVEVVESEGRLAIALELVEGEPLSAIMQEALPAERVMLLAGQLLRGLEHAHALGLVHRDLKPDNVLVDKRNGRDHARIIDFGIAIAHEGSADSVERLTADGVVIGTPEYMSPEQSRGQMVDHRADLYSLGMMVYEMLTGRLPFDGRPIDILAAKLKRDPPAMADRTPGLEIDPLLELFCRTLMARDLRKRFATARDALTALQLLGTDPAGARLALGIMDVDKALALISLPPPPRR